MLIHQFPDLIETLMAWQFVEQFAWTWKASAVNLIDPQDWASKLGSTVLCAEIVDDARNSESQLGLRRQEEGKINS